MVTAAPLSPRRVLPRCSPFVHPMPATPSGAPSSNGVALRVVQTHRTLRHRPLRRFREVVCFAVAAVLWALAWYGDREGFSGTTGHRVLALLAFLEAVTLGGLFWLEQGRSRGPGGLRWITVAWLSIPLWAALDVIVASGLRAFA